MERIDETPDGVVPEIVACGPLDGMSEEYAGDGEEFQKIEIGNAGLGGCVHKLCRFCTAVKLVLFPDALLELL